MTISTILKAIKGRRLNAKLYPTSDIIELLYDSRRVNLPAQSLFFALKSQRNDGHKYIADLYKKGVRNFVVSTVPRKQYPEANFIQVKDTLRALQQLATYHRRQFSLPVIGITGSNGKTIVKEWLYQILQKTGKEQMVRSPKSYNSQIGVPLSVWQIKKEHTLGIFEAGISTIGEMVKLMDMIRPTIGILTNIGTAHDEGFKDKLQKLYEKLILFEKAKVVICNGDDNFIQTMMLLIGMNEKAFTWGFEAQNDLVILDIDKKDHTTIKAKFKGQQMAITIPFSDDASIENALHCWATLLYLGYQQTQFQAYFQTLQPIALRLALHKAINNSTLINDSYSLDIHSLTVALDFLQQQNTHTTRTLILSDILESGQADAVLYQTVAQLLIQKQINRLIGIGRIIPIIQKYLPDSFQTIFYSTTADFVSHFNSTDFQNESILLKGARTFAFEKIAALLEQKAHQTILEVNLNAFINNLNVYKSMLKPTTKMMVMVKASAYGSGSDEVAKLLEYQGVDYLAVAYTDEGVALRQAGIKLPIMVLNPEPSSFDAMIRHRLEPEVYNFSVLHQFIKILASYNTELPYPIHIKLDTGMRRLGFELQHIAELTTILNNHSIVKIASIFSHLVGSDSAEHDAFSHEQASRFMEMHTKLMEGLLINQKTAMPIQHLCNSGGISRFPTYHFDMVRLGIGLYGLDSNPEIQAQLTTVSTLKATISQIKSLQKDETVGYNRSGKAAKATRTATISIGYADGFPRALGNGNGSVWLHGQEAFVIGNVCMDMCMVDISDIPEAKEGDVVEVFGAALPIQQVAARLNTIPYEVFTNISDRVKRVYFQE